MNQNDTSHLMVQPLPVDNFAKNLQDFLQRAPLKGREVERYNATWADLTAVKDGQLVVIRRADLEAVSRRLHSAEQAQEEFDPIRRAMDRFPEFQTLVDTWVDALRKEECAEEEEERERGLEDGE